MIRALLSALVLASSLPACSAKADSGKANALTSTQRTQVVQVVRDAMKKDPSILREAIFALRADNARVEAKAARGAVLGQRGAVSGPGDPVAGNPQGRVTIAEFFDPRCPYCRQLAPELTRFLVQSPDVRLVYKDLPILGPGSELGSRALLAAQRQGAYEGLRVAIMGDSREMTIDSIHDSAARLGLNWQRLRRDMDDPVIARKLAANKRLAQALGIDGTPALVIGQTVISGADMPGIAAAVAAARRSGSPNRSAATTKMSAIARPQ
jgi:protein-disulfide isomerase